jgi:outer membrane protein TolC
VRVVLIAAAMAMAAGGPISAQGQYPADGQPTRSTTASSTAGPTVAPPASATFLGGVPSGQPTPNVITISILDAMKRALDHNLGVLLAEQQVGHAAGTRSRALADLLPNVNGRISETRQEISLKAFGFSGTGAFANVPTIVGPFNVFDARAYVSQAVLDLGALNTARAESHNVEAARHTYRGARDLVIWVAGALYLQALAADARADAARSQQATAQAIYMQASDLRQSGIVAGIDVLRAEVELGAETQRATGAANDAEKAKLQLARVIGLPLGQMFAIDPMVPELPAPDLTLEQAVDRAYATRADFQAALERVRAAEAARQAVVGDSRPAVRVNADYGDIGVSLTDSHSTFSVTGAVQIPIFQGGRTRARLLEADADLRNRRAEAEDLKASIYYDVRNAFLDLQATSEQLQVATKARDLAAQQLVQSRDRFAAGVVSNIEVVQSQAAVAVANEQYISALYGYDLAKAALIRGLGTAEETLRQYLGGGR